MIILNQLLNISDKTKNDWTICLNNPPEEGIYSFSENFERLMEHISWKTHKNGNTFRIINTKYCLQFIRLDRDLAFDEWLFLGAFEVNGVQKHDDKHETYNLIKTDIFSEYDNRLIIRYKKSRGNKQVKLKIDSINTIEVVKILDRQYTDCVVEFNGYDNVSLSFRELKRIVSLNVDNWRNLLSKINCVYVITDRKTGKLYVGSTYGENGVWQRWSCYVGTNGTGGNDKLTELIKQDNDYALNNFTFTILETFFSYEKKEIIIQRERYWINVLDTVEHGNNSL